MSIDLSKSSNDLGTTNHDDPLLAELRQIKGDRTYIDLADQIGMYEGMLRAYMSGRSDAGIDTLAVLLAWDLSSRDLPDLGSLPKLTRLIVLKLLSRGRRIREREQEVTLETSVA